MYTSKDLSPEALVGLLEASAAINSAQELEKTLHAIATTAASVMRAEASSVIMLDHARNKQVFAAAFGDRSQELIGVEYDADAGISAEVLRSGHPQIVHDVSLAEAHFTDIDTKVGFKTRSLLAAPLIHRGEKLGVVEVLNPLEARRFTEKDSQLAQVFANLAAIAVANSKLLGRYERDNRGLKQQLRPDDEMLGSSDAMQQIRDLIRRVGPTNATVLLTGETGTGKELAARSVHQCSERSERAFIPVNCAALPRTLLESELFGHEAGAFTGATGRKLGRFELADGGTIFLDEVSEIATDVQVKLLRVLQEREIVRVGGTRAIGCDVRVIAATNRDLDEEMRTGRFRKDLYFRLNVFPIEIPPLRDRREDIPLLIDHFLKQIAGELKIPEPSISERASSALMGHDFPGNVRELQNVLERACLLCYAPGSEPARIQPQHLPREYLLHDEPGGMDGQGGSALAAGEKAMIINALRANEWNQSRSARALGISRDNIRYRIKKYGIKKPQ